MWRTISRKRSERAPQSTEAGGGDGAAGTARTVARCRDGQRRAAPNAPPTRASWASWASRGVHSCPIRERGGGARTTEPCGFVLWRPLPSSRCARLGDSEVPSSNLGAPTIGQAETLALAGVSVLEGSPCISRRKPRKTAGTWRLLARDWRATVAGTRPTCSDACSGSRYEHSMRVLRWFVAGSLVIAISGVWGATLPPVNAATGGNGLPAPVTLNGVGGVVVGMTAQQMRRIWGIPMPVIEDGLVDRSYGGICAGKMHGAAFFVLGDLKTLIFFKGAVTDRGVGVARVFVSSVPRMASTPSRGDERFIDSSMEGCRAWATTNARVAIPSLHHGTRRCASLRHRGWSQVRHRPPTPVHRKRDLLTTNEVGWRGPGGLPERRTPRLFSGFTRPRFKMPRSSSVGTAGVRSTAFPRPASAYSPTQDTTAP